MSPNGICLRSIAMLEMMTMGKMKIPPPDIRGEAIFTASGKSYPGRGGAARIMWGRYRSFPSAAT